MDDEVFHGDYVGGKIKRYDFSGGQGVGGWVVIVEYSITTIHWVKGFLMAGSITGHSHRDRPQSESVWTSYAIPLNHHLLRQPS